MAILKRTHLCPWGTYLEAPYCGVELTTNLPLLETMSIESYHYKIGSVTKVLNFDKQNFTILW